MIKKFAGVNIAVKDLDAAVKKYESVLGVKSVPTDPNDFAFPGLRGASLWIGEVMINLITSEQAGNSIANFLETRGEGVFLLSLEVDDVDKATKELSEKGVKFVSDTPLSFSAGKVNFGHPKSMHGVQWEFVQLAADTKFTK